MHPQSITRSRDAEGRFTPEHTPLEQRFWARVARSDDPEACWLWTGVILNNGYGVIKSLGSQRRLLLAHRVAYELQNGPIPAGHYVCHRCDTPACVRGSHLFTGTALDNNRDAAAKGRSAHGENHGWHRLTDSEVLEIRRLAADGTPYSRMAGLFGVSISAIHRAGTRKTWKHLP